MITIGKFTKRETEFAGMIETRFWSTPATIVEVKKSEDKAPDYRVMAGRYKIGSAWSNKSKAGNSYIAVTLDDPGFAAPINANLYQSEEGYDLVWKRAKA